MSKIGLCILFVLAVVAILAAYAAQMNDHESDLAPLASPSPSASEIVIASPLPFQTEHPRQQPGVASSPGGITGVYSLPDPAGLGA